MPPRSMWASLPASILSLLALPPWMCFMARAWPRTKGMRLSSQRSASQYQANMHSQPTTRFLRKGLTASRKASGSAGRSRSKTVLPLALEDVHEHGSGVQIDAGIELVWLVVVRHGCLLVW